MGSTPIGEALVFFSRSSLPLLLYSSSSFSSLLLSSPPLWFLLRLPSSSPPPPPPLSLSSLFSSGVAFSLSTSMLCLLGASSSSPSSCWLLLERDAVVLLCVCRGVSLLSEHGTLFSRGRALLPPNRPPPFFASCALSVPLARLPSPISSSISGLCSGRGRLCTDASSLCLL